MMNKKSNIPNSFAEKPYKRRFLSSIVAAAAVADFQFIFGHCYKSQ